MKKLTVEAEKLLLYICKHREDVCKDGFSVSIFSSRQVLGKAPVDQITPFLEELVEEGYLKIRKSALRAQRYSLVPKKADKYLQELEEEAMVKEYREALEDEIKGYKKFVVTTAVMGKEVNKPFLESIKNYAERNNALLLVLPCEDVASRGKKAAPIELSPELKDFRVVFKDTYLNRNLCLCAIKMSAKQINPLSGLDRLAVSRQASITVASPKVFLKYIPNMHYDIPPAIMTTGAITVNDYDNDRYMSKRTSTLAENDHAYGAVIIEVENDNIFHFRHVQASVDGTLTDMGIEYLPDGSINKMKNTVMVVGDSHVGYHDRELHEKVMELASIANVKTTVLHDIFHGSSISHHDWNKSITRAQRAQEGRLGLENECVAVRNYIQDIENRGINVAIVNSNHDNHLKRYLEDGRYVNDPINHKFSLQLAVPAIDGINPLQYAIESLLGFRKESVQWLEADKSRKYYGVEVNLHGDKGSNGARGSLNTFNKGIGNCVTAHTHTAAILRNTYSVGTVGLMDMKYNEGMSNWTRTCCLIYSNGTKQLVNFIPNSEGEYTYQVK